MRAYYTCKKITNSETMQFLCKTVERQGYVLYSMYILESVRKTILLKFSNGINLYDQVDFSNFEPTAGLQL